MEIAANLLRLANEWIVAQVDEVEGETLPGDPDCILRQPFMVDYEGNLSQWPKNSDAVSYTHLTLPTIYSV